MHLFLYGESGAGKTTLIRQALHKKRALRPRGFCTSKRQAGPGETAVYLNDAGQEPDFGPGRMVARWAQGPGCAPFREVYPERFDGLGAEALSELPLGEVVLMDELGYLERDAVAFQARVLAALDAPCRVLGVIKERHGNDPFLSRVKGHPRVKLKKVTRENREEIRALLEGFLTPPTLVEALEVRPGVTAIVGGGGKTTLLGRLGQELSKKGTVIVCTTTHVFPPGLPSLMEPTAGEVREALREHSPLFIGTPSDERRMGPCELVRTGEVADLADYVIAEADGSRRLPLKAPGDHEPPLPPHCGHVIAVAGMSGVGRLMGESVHRPERYGPLVGKTPEQPVLPEDCARVLSHPEGQRKHVGDRRFSVLLNQAELPEGWQAAQAIARAWKEHTVIASLHREQAVLEIWRDQICWW